MFGEFFCVELSAQVTVKSAGTGLCLASIALYWLRSLVTLAKSG